MKKKITGLALSALLFALCLSADAQQPTKILWIGYLTGSGSSPNPAFVQGMRDLGYVEGKNIGFVYRTGEGKRERYLAAELVRLKVDIIFADVFSAQLAAKEATSTIPIVIASSTDPVGTGLVASLARPGGNVTGLANITGELGGNF
jgi:putative ABC transport system substrate-binding protein